MRILAIILVFTLLFISCAKDPPADPQAPALMKYKTLKDGLTFPWEILWGGDGYLWLTERAGKISRLNPENGDLIPVITIDEVVTKGEGGLLGMALHPDFANQPQVFLAYTYNKGGVYTEKIVRFNYDGTTLISPLTLVDDIKGGNIHNGSRLVIENNYLFVTTGDAGDQTLPQNNSSLNGKILRVHLDGSIPADNPFAGSAIWTSGHRNPQGLVFAGSNLMSSEHGPDSDDEINHIVSGGNYGWPIVKGKCDEPGESEACNSIDNLQPSIFEWTPTIAVSGMDYYNSDYFPQWKGSLLVACLKAEKLMQLKLSDGSSTPIEEATAFFDGAEGRLRDICISPEGKVYICTSNGNNDKIIEVYKD